MAGVKFYLKDPSASISQIYAHLSLRYYEIDVAGKKRFRAMKLYTTESINPQYWDKKKMRAKQNSRFAQYPEFNQRLDDIETVIKDVFRSFLNQGRGNEITPSLLRAQVKQQLLKLNKSVQPLSEKNSFTHFIRNIIRESEDGLRLTDKGTRLRHFTLNSYRTTLKNLLDFEAHQQRSLQFADINLDFYKAFLKYQNDHQRAINTIGGHIKNIKLFMRIALLRGLHENREFEKREFRTIDEQVESIYLSEAELQRIYDCDFSEDKKLKAVRDMFIIGCYTGLRFSDLQQLHRDHFSDHTLRISTIKTGENVVIPLHWMVREICHKYGFELPRVISNQKMNEYLKDIGIRAGIDELVIQRETRGGVRCDKKCRKYELITVHTARRSFATNMFLNDIPTLSIMKITGHRTEKSFLKYIKISPEENAQKLLHHPFFRKSRDNSPNPTTATGKLKALKNTDRNHLDETEFNNTMIK